jgi:hypothetical protein
MEVSKNNNTANLSEGTPVKPAQETVPVESQEKSNTFSDETDYFISYTHDTRDMHWYSEGKAITHGILFQKEEELASSDNDVFHANSIVSYNLTGNGSSITFAQQFGVKLKVGLDDIANAYVSGTVGYNAGILDGSVSGGVGARGAVGAELGPVYGELFREYSTNYTSNGFAIGLRFH